MDHQTGWRDSPPGSVGNRAYDQAQLDVDGEGFDEDGLEGEEGTFLLCTFWLAHAQALSADATAARETYERVISVRNDLGLLAEEFADGAMLGNFPQAFSHVGLVTAAAAIAACEAP